MMKCTYCNNEVMFDYLMDEHDNTFCTAECLDVYMSHNPSKYEGSFHPYIDVYEYVRSEYIYMINNWEKRLIHAEDYFQVIDDLLTEVDLLIDEHFNFFISDGDDGVFHREIRQYLQKLHALRKDIVTWSPIRDEFYRVMLLFNENGEIQLSQDSYTNYDTAYERLRSYLRENNEIATALLDDMEIGRVDDPYQSIYDNNIYFIYDDRTDAEEVLTSFQTYFTDEEMEGLFDPVYLCDSGCGLFLSFNDGEFDEDGWLYKDLCKERECPGTYSNEELEKIVSTDIDDLPFSIGHIPSVMKVRRSCVVHDIPYPVWAED